MKALSIILFLGFAWLCASCIVGGAVPTKLPIPKIYYRNTQGQDLLDPATPSYFNSVTIKWLNPNGSVGIQEATIIKQTTINPSFPFLPNGNSFSIDPFLIQDNNGNNGIVQGSACNVFIQLNKSVTDTITFIYSGASLQKFFYNKTMISPPNPLITYPTTFPVIISK